MPSAYTEWDDTEIAELDALVAASEAKWGDEITDLAHWPSLEEFRSRNDYEEQIGRYDDYLTGHETRQIGRILFHLKAFKVDTVEAMEAVIAAHNDGLRADLDDPEYSKRTGNNAERLRQAIFSSEAEKEILLNAVSRHGAGVLHKSGYARLLARHSNVNRVIQALEVLRAAGFMTTRKGANNADIFLSDGRLEAAHRRYLERISAAVLERVSL